MFAVLSVKEATKIYKNIIKNLDKENLVIDTKQKPLKKKLFQIDGVIRKDNGKKFTEKEKDQLLDDFIDFLEQKKLNFIGVTV